MNPSLKQFGTHFLVILGFVLVAVLYFNPVLKGKKIYQSDIVQYTGMAKQQIDFRKAYDAESYWTNSAFGGMPTYQLGAKYPHNYIKQLDLALRFLPRPADYLFLYLLGFYILLLVLKVDYKVAALGAFAFGFSTYLIIILGVGHNSKAHAIAYMPLVLSGIILTFQKRYYLGFILTAVASGLELATNHPQMTYYLGFLIIILGFSYLIQAIKIKELPSFFKASAILLVAAVLAFGMNATNLMATSEYAKESTRGQSELTINSDGSAKEQTTGLERAYITQFSYGILETFNLFIPRFMGGGNRENLGKDSETYKAYRALGATPLQALQESKQAPMYWGNQPIVEAPAYIGAVVIFLFVLALFLYQGRFKWWLIAGVLMSLFLSYGKNLSFLTDLFIDYVPLYNKFRAVSSIQVILELCIPLLAVLGLSQLFQKDVSSETKLYALKKSLGIVAGLTVLFLIFKNSLFDFVGMSDGQFKEYYGASFVEALRMDRSTIFTEDALRTLLLVLAVGGLIFAYLKQKIAQNTTIVILGVILIFDLVGVDLRYVNNDNFVSAIKVDRPYQASKIDKEILKDTTNFRVFDMSDNSTKASYFHNSIGGYHAAKLKRFKALQEFHIDKNNFEVLNMLNTKYIIYQNKEGEVLYFENEKANGNAWFVDAIETFETADEEILSFDKINTKTTATANTSELKSQRFAKDSTASIQLVNYKLNHLVYATQNLEDGFAVFSEAYYKNGWNVTIDGVEVEHYNVDYVLRGLEIPKGEHTVVFSFNPAVVATGSNISLGSTILLVLLILGQGLLIYRKPS
ncbi:membrane protein [Formosa sp. Hel1_33_131]|uniref:YfhO family protein n=1 Tax=Formosa sp. Hel1_33_131 TaxID=1336794 RepID=UPI00084E11DE|nr:YfhO family protein [Formosa sp. Hel1_33_131]AOR29337.1 membrane protein [Formosa sp. Hel1_33_131]